MGDSDATGGRAVTPDMDCPGNGKRGAPVALRTVKAMLVPEALRRVGREQHYYCSDTGCSVVYFSRGGAHYSTEDVSVPVAEKQVGRPRLVCYCFGYVAEEAVAASGFAEPAAIVAIRSHVNAGRCACDVRNPSGRCCLRSLAAN